jgi:hypothetical protein
MTSGPSERSWGDIGRRFERSEPDRGNTKPSEWYILLFCITLLRNWPRRSEEPAGRLRRERMRKIDGEESSPGDRTWRQLFRIPCWKSKVSKDRKGKIKKVARSGGFWIATISATNFGYLYHDLVNLGLKLFIPGLITTYERHSPLLSPLSLLSPSSLLSFISTL